MSVTKQFVRYVTQNIFGMLGISCYIIADTFFIAKAAGTDGITVLNLVLPIYNLIFAIGSMIGVGSATRFTILRAQGEERAHDYFSNAICFVWMIGILFTLAGIFIPDKIIALMGGDAGIVALGTGYTRIFLLFTPFFMMNYVIMAFVRNDNQPSLAMAGTLAGSFSNILFDYIFMFPLGMGLEGAALATAASADHQHSDLQRAFPWKKEYCAVPAARAVHRPVIRGVSAWRPGICGGDFFRSHHDRVQFPDARSCGKYRCGGLRSDRELCACGNGNLQRSVAGSAADRERLLRKRRCEIRPENTKPRTCRGFGHRGSAHRSRLRIYGFSGKSV